MTDWRNRIVGEGVKPASQFLANPHNWRVHPKRQREALKASLNEVGWVQRVIENVRTGHLVDGHERVWSALQNGDADVPYIQVDLSEEEEALVLATFDPIGAMAIADRDKLDELLSEVNIGKAALQEVLIELAANEGIMPTNVQFREFGESVEDDGEYIQCPKCGHRWPNEHTLVNRGHSYDKCVQIVRWTEIKG